MVTAYCRCALPTQLGRVRRVCLRHSVPVRIDLRALLSGWQLWTKIGSVCVADVARPLGFVVGRASLQVRFIIGPTSRSPRVSREGGVWMLPTTR
jgi:hypothetical protein